MNVMNVVILGIAIAIFVTLLVGVICHLMQAIRDFEQQRAARALPAIMICVDGLMAAGILMAFALVVRWFFLHG